MTVGEAEKAAPLHPCEIYVWLYRCILSRRGRVSDLAGSQRHDKLPMAGNRKAGWKNRFQLLDQRLSRSKFSKNDCYVTYCLGTVLQM